jgi:hypothetical protein
MYACSICIFGKIIIVIRGIEYIVIIKNVSKFYNYIYN